MGVSLAKTKSEPENYQNQVNQDPRSEREKLKSRLFQQPSPRPAATGTRRTSSPSPTSSQANSSSIPPPPWLGYPHETAKSLIVPNNPWAWVSGTATLPAGLAGILARKVGLASLVGRNLLLSPSSLLKSFSNGDSRDALDQTKSKSLSKNKNLINRDEGDKEKTKQKSLSTQSQSAAAGPDVAIVDAVITGNLLQAASGPEGRFLLPAIHPQNGAINAPNAV